MEHSPLIREKITEQLKIKIIEMRTDSFVRIESERSLAEKYGVSRISMRMAIKNLISEGLLVQLQGKGTYITPKVKIDTLHIICSPDIKNNDPFYNKFLVEITNASARKSINLLMIDPDNITDVPVSIPLIVVGLLEECVLNRLMTVYKEIVAIHDYPNLKDIVQIYFDDYKIGYNAAKTFIELNHKSLLHLSGPEKYASAYYRKKGFMDAVKDFNAHAAAINGKMNWSGGYSAGDAFLRNQYRDHPPSGVFAANDWMAIGFIQKLKENGVKVPEDISVIGCDDIPLASEFFPPLTTFNLDMKYLVEEIFSVLNPYNNENVRSNKRILLPAALVRRKSLKKYGQKKE